MGAVLLEIVHLFKQHTQNYVF